jgi:hypothetical protein
MVVARILAGIAISIGFSIFLIAFVLAPATTPQPTAEEPARQATAFERTVEAAKKACGTERRTSEYVKCLERFYRDN